MVSLNDSRWLLITSSLFPLTVTSCIDEPFASDSYLIRRDFEIGYFENKAMPIFCSRWASNSIWKDIKTRHGVTILLEASPETILKRVKKDDNRPLLEGKKNVSDIAAMMEARRPAYEAAANLHVSVDGRTPAEIAEEIAGYVPPIL